MPNESKTQELRRFLNHLDDADVNVTDWEAKFIGSNLESRCFSTKQREIIMELIENYGRRIGWN